MSLNSKFFSLVFFFQFFQKGRKALWRAIIKAIFMAKIEIISQPLNIVTVLSRRNSPLFQERSVEMTT